MAEVRSQDVPAILRWREEGQSCREIGERLGVPGWRIENVMKATGNDGKWHAKPKYSTRRKPTGTRGNRWSDIVDRHGSLYIERGAWAGYVATIDDQWTGCEQPTIDEAIHSAVEALKGEQ